MTSHFGMRVTPTGIIRSHDALRAHAKGETDTHAVQTLNWAVVSDATGAVMGLFTTYNKCRTLPGQHIEYVPTGQRVIA